MAIVSNRYTATERARESYECPARVLRHCPVSADHSLIVLSSLQLATFEPSGDHATEFTSWLQNGPFLTFQLLI